MISPELATICWNVIAVSSAIAATILIVASVVGIVYTGYEMVRPRE